MCTNRDLYFSVGILNVINHIYYLNMNKMTIFAFKMLAVKFEPILTAKIELCLYNYTLEYLHN